MNEDVDPINDSDLANNVTSLFADMLSNGYPIAFVALENQSAEFARVFTDTHPGMIVVPAISSDEHVLIVEDKLTPEFIEVIKMTVTPEALTAVGATSLKRRIFDDGATEQTDVGPVSTRVH
jgi:hypothetical protein